jgi:hypothetical protein
MELTFFQVVGLLVTGGLGSHGLMFLLVGLKARNLWDEGEPGAGATAAGGAIILAMALALLIWVIVG